MQPGDVHNTGVMDTEKSSLCSAAVVPSVEGRRGPCVRQMMEFAQLQRSYTAARNCRGTSLRNLTTLNLALLTIYALLFVPAQTAFIDFDNCLGLDVQTSKPPNQYLQFQPLFVWAAFDTHHPNHNLNVTVFGNVAGQAAAGIYPPRDSPQWENDNDAFGKIVDISKETNTASTLKARFNVLDYTPYVEKGTRFCNTTVQGHCPLAPIFYPQNA